MAVVELDRLQQARVAQVQVNKAQSHTAKLPSDDLGQCESCRNATDERGAYGTRGKRGHATWICAVGQEQLVGGRQRRRRGRRRGPHARRKGRTWKRSQANRTKILVARAQPCVDRQSKPGAIDESSRRWIVHAEQDHTRLGRCWTLMFVKSTLDQTRL